MICPHRAATNPHLQARSHVRMEAPLVFEATLEAKMVPGGPNVFKSAPKREPRSLQNRPQRALANLTKHMVFTVRITHGASPDTLGNSNFFQNASRHSLLSDFFEFVRHFGAPGLKKDAQRGEHSTARWNPTSNFSLWDSKVGRKGSPDPQKLDHSIPER